MRQRQRPQTKVRGRVRDASQTELYSVNDLMNDHFAEIMMFLYPKKPKQKEFQRHVSKIVEETRRRRTMTQIIRLAFIIR